MNNLLFRTGEFACPKRSTHTRKGQFFILGAVVILLVLYGIIGTLNSNWNSDVSEVQRDEAPQIFKNIEYGINTTIHASDDSNIEENLEKFVRVEKKAIGEEYNLDAFFNITSTAVDANITLNSKSFYATKAISFVR